MKAGKVTLRFYHSVVCPRCHMANLALRTALRKRPDIELEKIEMLTRGDEARRDGVRRFPALVAGDHRLEGFVLTPGRIRRFLESLTAASPPAA